jgi:hypothetical protein
VTLLGGQCSDCEATERINPALEWTENCLVTLSEAQQSNSGSTSAFHPDLTVADVALGQPGVANGSHGCSSWRMIALYACHELWKKVFLSRQLLIDDQF